MEKEKRRDRESIGLTYTTTHFHRGEFNLRGKKWEKFTAGQYAGECLSEPHNAIPPKVDLRARLPAATDEPLAAHSKVRA
jgi:hypothetical protein